MNKNLKNILKKFDLGFVELSAAEQNNFWLDLDDSGSIISISKAKERKPDAGIEVAHAIAN